MKTKNIWSIFVCVFLSFLFSHMNVFAKDVVAAPKQGASRCEERTENLLDIEVDLAACREEMAKWEQGVNSLQENLDQLTTVLTATAGGAMGLVTIDTNKICDQEMLDKKPEVLSQEMKISCINRGIVEVRKKSDENKKYLNQAKEQEKKLLTELFQLRDIMTAAGCKVIVQPKPKEPQSTTTQPANTQESVGGFFDPSLEGFVEDLLALITATPPKQDFTRFAGKWSGTAKMISSHEPSIVGATRSYVLEIAVTDTGINLKSSAGVIGNPAAYKAKRDGNHLRVDYSGPFVTPGLEQIQTTLTYWLDVTLNGASLTGQTYTQANTSYEGQSTEKRFLMALELKR